MFETVLPLTTDSRPKRLALSALFVSEKRTERFSSILDFWKTVTKNISSLVKSSKSFIQSNIAFHINTNHITIYRKLTGMSITTKHKYLKRILEPGGENLWDCDPDKESTSWTPDVLRIRSATPLTIFMLSPPRCIYESRLHNPIIGMTMEIPAHHLHRIHLFITYHINHHYVSKTYVIHSKY